MAMKTTKAARLQRISDVAQLVAEGADRRALIRYASETWGVCERVVDDYLAGARELLRAQAEEDAADAMARHLAMRRDLYQTARSGGDVRGALEVARDEAKLLGMYTDRLQMDVTLESETLADTLALLARRAEGLEP